MSYPRKRYSVEVLISIISGRLVCDFGDMHECLERLAGGSLWTHQLPRIATASTSVLLVRFPELGACQGVSGLDACIERLGDEAGVTAWVRAFLNEHTDIHREYDVEPIGDGWLLRDPVKELIEMRGDDQGIIGVVI